MIASSKNRVLAAAGALLLSGWIGHASADVVTYSDFATWSDAAGSIVTVDFDTLPDGQPSVDGTTITSTFNYTSAGVTFSGGPTLEIKGSGALGFEIVAYVPSPPPMGQMPSLRAELGTPVYAIGVLYKIGASTRFLDQNGQFVTGYFSTSPGFFGAISDVPIASVNAFDPAIRAGFDAFYFSGPAPIPEPETYAMLLAGLGLLGFMARRRKQKEAA